jgi:hypothetical protein
MRSRRAADLAVVLTAVGVITAACGQKGPPLAPLHLVPAAVSELSLRRAGDRARLRFVLPTRNENGPGRLELDRVEIYAMTIPANSLEPSARELLSRERLVGEIAVQPVLEEGQAAAPDDKRPAPGSTITFDEELTAEKLTPVEVKTPLELAAVAAAAAAGRGGAAPASAAAAATPPAAAAPATTAPATAAPAAPPAAPAATPPATPPATAAAPAPAAPAAQAPAAAAPPAQKPGTFPFVRRLYVVRGVTRTGRPGAESPRTGIPLVPLPPPPPKVTAAFTEKAVTAAWEAQPGAAAYNVYRGDDLLQPVNPAPVTSPAFEEPLTAVGTEQCYRVRSVAVVAPVMLEGDASAPACVTPRDQFPPAAPRGLAAVPTAGQISLIWDANGEKDLAGYIVLRGETPEALAAITPAPIKETSYRETTVKPGTRYVYAIVAVDAATPPNMSAQSARVEEIAR